ncbi:MAG: hypothetical protein R3F17_07450 [Planctomycetota bacterium]
MSAPTDPLQTFAAALGICHETLDWSHLGTLYCEEGGEDFFSEQAVEAIQMPACRSSATCRKFWRRRPAPPACTWASGSRS